MDLVRREATGRPEEITCLLSDSSRQIVTLDLNNNKKLVCLCYYMEATLIFNLPG